MGGTTTQDDAALRRLTFAQAELKDFVGIAELDSRAWSDSAHPERVPDGEHVWRVWVADAFVWVARDGERIVGAVVAFPTRDRGLFVHKLMVETTYRRSGVGARLFELLLAHVDATVRAACYLTVDPSKTAEVRRYERLGFTEKRLVAGYYRDDEDRYVMKRPPAPPA